MPHPTLRLTARAVNTRWVLVGFSHVQVNQKANDRNCVAHSLLRITCKLTLPTISFKKRAFLWQETSMLTLNLIIQEKHRTVGKTCSEHLIMEDYVAMQVGNGHK